MLTVSLLVASCVVPFIPQTNTDALFVPFEVRATSTVDGACEETVGALRLELLADSRATHVSFAVPGYREVKLARTDFAPAWGGGHVWTGRLDEENNGSAVFSVLDGVCSGSVRVDERLFVVEADRGGLHRVREVFEANMPTCGTTDAHAVPALEVAGSALTPLQFMSSASAPTIDVLVVYTTEAKNADGGTSQIVAKINLAIAESNQAYANSQVVQRLRLVHASELVGYTEDPDFGTNLSVMRNTSDGVIDGVHTLRNQYGADMVAMIVAGTQYCGLGYLMQTVSTSFEDRAFTVTSRVCATGYYSFAHELGHNMGCHHDRANASVGAYPYSYGYRTSNGAWRTIMAYAPGTRIQYFSNPNVSYSGFPLGIADPAADSAENWKSLNNTAATVAQFRCAIPLAFGTSKLTSAGTQATLTYTGTTSLAANDLDIRIQQGLPGKAAIAFWGTTEGSAPWNGGHLYVSGPKKRLGVRVLDANGAADFAFPTALCQVGDVIFCQGWFRDPLVADGSTVGLTHGLRLEFCP